MRLTRTLSLTLLLTLVPAAAAGASTISTTATEVDYTGGAGETLSMHVYLGNDSDLANQTAVYFLPNDNTIVDPTTSDANCRSRPTGASSCVYKGLTKVTSQGKDDLVAVDAAGNEVRIDAGAGNDTVFSTAGTRVTANGQEGNDSLIGGTGIDTLDGGPGDDKLSGYGMFDDLHGGTGFDTLQMVNGGGVVSLDDSPNDGPNATPNENVHSDIEKVAGGDGADQIDGNAGPNTLDGGSGNDTINGLGGADTLIGGIGDDVIAARDGAADSVSCGPGNDKAIVDPADTVAPDCETVEYADDDHDGSDARSDCNDANAAIHPGAIDVPGNGIDEDCSGADAPVLGGSNGGGGQTTGSLDADNDGTSPPVDCNDGSAAIHPGGVDTPGDGIDQDCSGADAKLKRVGARVTDRWTVTKTRARVDRLTIRAVPKGGKVMVDCKGGGCPFKRHAVKVKSGKADAGKLFKRHQLRVGTTVQVTITAPGLVGKVMRYTFKGRLKVPSGKQLCLQPGALSATSCG